MMRHNWYAPTINLNQVDENCVELDYITCNVKEMENEIVMSNTYAFGGINTSLIFKRWPAWLPRSSVILLLLAR